MFASYNPRALGIAQAARESIAMARGAGFEGVDLLILDLIEAGERPAELRRLMDDLGLRAGAFPLPIQWRDRAEVDFRRDLDALPRLAEAASVIGLLRTGTWIFPTIPAPETLPGHLASGDPESRLLGFVEDRLGRIVEVLAGFEIRLGIEVIGVESFRAPGRPPFFCRLGDERLDGLIERLNRPHSGEPIGLLVDSFHLAAAGESADVGVSRGVDQVVWVHAAGLPADFRGDRAAILDHDRGLPGTDGDPNLPKLLGLLSSSDYDGPVTPEPMGTCRELAGLSPRDRADRTRAALRSVWPSET